MSSRWALPYVGLELLWFAIGRIIHPPHFGLCVHTICGDDFDASAGMGKRCAEARKCERRLGDGGPNHFDMNEAFCACMRMAIATGLENAPTGVITTPGTQNPKYVPAEPSPLASSLGAMDL